MTVRTVTMGNGTYIEWSSRFDCDQQDEGKTAAQVHDGVLVPGLRALEERFGIAGRGPGLAT